MENKTIFKHNLKQLYVFLAMGPSHDNNKWKKKKTDNKALKKWEKAAFI